MNKFEQLVFKGLREELSELIERFSDAFILPDETSFHPFARLLIRGFEEAIEEVKSKSASVRD